MRKNQVLQSVFRKKCSQIRAVGIGQMPASSADTHLEIIRIASCKQHFRIVVTLKHHGLTADESGLHVLRHHADVGCKTDIDDFVSVGKHDAITHAHPAVMRDREGNHRRFAASGGKAGIVMNHHAGRNLRQRIPGKPCGGSRRDMYGDMIFFREHFQRTDVIAVLVRHKNRADPRKIASHGPERGTERFDIFTGVNEKADRRCFHQCRVSRRSGIQNTDTVFHVNQVPRPPRSRIQRYAKSNRKERSSGTIR